MDIYPDIFKFHQLLIDLLLFQNKIPQRLYLLLKILLIVQIFLLMIYKKGLSVWYQHENLGLKSVDVFTGKKILKPKGRYFGY